MTNYTIKSARYSSPYGDVVVIDTVENGHMVVSQRDMPALWADVTSKVVPTPWVEPKVDQVTAAQALLALDEAGLLDTVETKVKTSPSRALKIWYDRAQVWNRKNPFVLTLASELGLTSDQVDALFLSASQKV